MVEKAKVVLTDYVWESLDVEKNILGDLADLVGFQCQEHNVLSAEIGEVVGSANVRCHAHHSIGFDQRQALVLRLRANHVRRFLHHHGQ